MIMTVVRAVDDHEGEATSLFQITHEDVELLLSGTDATRLLGLPGLAVDGVDVDPDGTRVVRVATADPAAAACPVCGVFSVSPKEWATTRPKDIPYGCDVRLRWRKRRWRCREVRCPRKVFTESVAEVPPGSRCTGRLRRELAEAVAEQGATVLAAAQRYAVGWATAHAAFRARATPAAAAALPPVKVLGIDENRRGRPVWRQDPATGKWSLAVDTWHTGFVDSQGFCGLLGQVEGRSSAVVAGWLNCQPEAWRDAVTHVTIDLSACYAKAVRDALPHAQLVADRFHVDRLGNQMLTTVRQRVTRQWEGRRGRKTDHSWRSRRRLLTARENLTPKTFATMWNGLIDLGAPGEEILLAWIVKEDLRDLLALSGTNPDRHEIRTRLDRFYNRVANSGIPEAEKLAATVETWWPAIEAAIVTGFSNARSEGYNRVAKLVARNAYGFRNPANQRLRVRWACTRQHRGKQT